MANLTFNPETPKRKMWHPSLSKLPVLDTKLLDTKLKTSIRMGMRDARSLSPVESSSCYKQTIISQQSTPLRPLYYVVLLCRLEQLVRWRGAVRVRLDTPCVSKCRHRHLGVKGLGFRWLTLRAQLQKGFGFRGLGRSTVGISRSATLLPNPSSKL